MIPCQHLLDEVKKTTWETVERFPDVTEVFLHLSEQPDILSEANLAVLDRLVILMYGKTCDVLKVNEAMQIIFSQGSRNIENKPPTEAVLIDDIVDKKSAAYQAGHCWA